MAQVFAGLYPQANRIPIFHQRPSSSENLYPNYCARLEKLQKAYYKKAAEEWDPKLKEVSKALEKWIPGGIQVNGSPSAIGVFDTISACVANGIELPPQFLDKNFQRVLHDAMIAQWYSVYVENETACRLGIAPLLGDVLDRFTYASKHPHSPTKLALYGGHDNTLAPLLSALGVFDNKWPPSSSNVTFELFRDVTPLGVLDSLRLRHGEYFVRMMYNNRGLKVPGCRGVGRNRGGDESFCTLAAFREVVERLRPGDLVEECKIPEKEKTLPN